jgi:hypothetical protein
VAEHCPFAAGRVPRKGHVPAGRHVGAPTRRIQLVVAPDCQPSRPAFGMDPGAHGGRRPHVPRGRGALRRCAPGRSHDPVPPGASQPGMGERVMDARPAVPRPAWIMPRRSSAWLGARPFEKAQVTGGIPVRRVRGVSITDVHRPRSHRAMNQHVRCDVLRPRDLTSSLTTREPLLLPRRHRRTRRFRPPIHLAGRTDSARDFRQKAVYRSCFGQYRLPVPKSRSRSSLALQGVGHSGCPTLVSSQNRSEGLADG